MTDQEHATAVQAAAEALNEAILAAYRDGLDVLMDVESGALPNVLGAHAYRYPLQIVSAQVSRTIRPARGYVG